jgi:hypothetical protein
MLVSRDRRRPGDRRCGETFLIATRDAVRTPSRRARVADQAIGGAREEGAG